MGLFIPFVGFFSFFFVGVDFRKICTLVYTIRFHSAPNTRPLVFSRAHFLAFSLDCPRTRTILLLSFTRNTDTHTHTHTRTHARILISLSLSHTHTDCLSFFLSLPPSLSLSRARDLKRFRHSQLFSFLIIYTHVLLFSSLFLSAYLATFKYRIFRNN